ncbi:MAG: hypothetical protein KDK34_14480 [Leptospiraceae bacterium]|nr:hypothetical protein [Leptospiraceae bacterium]
MIKDSVRGVVVTAQTITHLIRILTEALFISPLNNLRGVVGRLRDLRRPTGPYSELDLIQVRNLRGIWRLFEYFLEVFLLPFGLKRRFDNYYKRESDSSGPELIHIDSGSAFEDERWIYINGVATNEDVARLNAQCIVALFQRPITIVCNPTGSLLPDLIEVTAQKAFYQRRRTARRALEFIRAELHKTEVRRVILLAHSQGAVIAAQIVRALRTDLNRPESELGKLEIYTFGNPADSMQYVRAPAGPKPGLPYMEHFANTGDLVARLGVLAMKARTRGDINIDGPVYVCNRFGHFFNEHYLHSLELGMYTPMNESDSGRATQSNFEARDKLKSSSARLCGYMHGARPMNRSF